MCHHSTSLQKADWVFFRDECCFRGVESVFVAVGKKDKAKV